jgi:hypothetical protein
MKTKTIVIIIAFLGLSFGCKPKQGVDPVEYLGSYSNIRTSDSGHVYIHELWLWKHSGDVVGLYLNVQGLEGGKIPVQTNKIGRASLSPEGVFSFETQWYKFSGRYDGSCVKGKLMQGSEVIWGGSEGSDEISFCSGSNIKNIENPAESINSIEDWHKWADTLP